jgi:AcrR family transcriptional regulator
MFNIPSTGVRLIVVKTAAPPARTRAAKAEVPAENRATRTRQALLDAGERILLRDGITGWSTRRVANEAGVNQALVHYHFETVDGLLVAVLERAAQKLWERSVAFHQEGPGSFFDQWRRGVDAMLAEDIATGWPKIWIEVVALSASHQEIQSILEKHIEETWASWDAALREILIERFPNLPAASIQALLDLFSSLSYGVMVKAVTGMERERIDAALLLLEHLFETGDLAGAGDAVATSAKAPTKNPRKRNVRARG